MKKYFFDVTDIVRYIAIERTVSGIQRAATMIIRCLADTLGAENIYMSYFDDRKQKYVALPADKFLQIDDFDLHEISTALALAVPAKKETAHFLQKYATGSLKYYFHRTKIDLAALRNDDAFFRKKGFSIHEWRDWRSGEKAADSAEVREPARVRPTLFSATFSPGDTLCILGALWDNPNLDDLFKDYRAAGLRIFLLVHDTIPLKFPDTVHVNPISFYSWLGQTTEYCDGYLANSKHTASDLREVLDMLGSSTEIHLTPLAQAPLPAARSRDGAPSDVATSPQEQLLNHLKSVSRRRPDIRNVTKLPYVLCVGTMEARKNSWRMAQAWLQLANDESLNLPRLVFAGKKGWLNNDFFDAYDKTGGFGGWVQIIEEPSDSDLTYLYENCEFTITASLYEGWGLPIGESLSYGKTAVVSETSAMPEVGRNMVVYCNPESIPSIANAARKLLSESGHRKMLENRIQQAQLRQWSDVAADVAAALTKDPTVNLVQMPDRASSAAVQHAAHTD
ncbi:glycosyltransferase family 4 protein [Candidatus Halocynthiibacter alkanivorans]|uniref:glycosyltransferase family 4 protein n=1 Tax=Candidatus Halocynthiibacter alkanivorans TaxID=2267619 RepID=UPI000DF44AAA|nr:glycosyltransferase family 1 protein [Candidatus Halocynthiibacter alkanivorans]